MSTSTSKRRKHRLLAVVPIFAAASIAALATPGGGRPDRPLSVPSRHAVESLARVPAAPAARVVVAAPRHRAGAIALGARVSRARTRVVAVSLFVDGRHAGTDTTAPYRLALDRDRPGTHVVRAVAVDRLGRRTTSPARRVRLAPDRGAVLTAAPGASFARAQRALLRGGVTVRLRAGRYALTGLRLARGAA